MNIFLDKFFFGFHDQAVYFDTIDTIPAGCDMVGLVFYHCDHGMIMHEIQAVRPKTKKLAVVLHQPNHEILPLIDRFKSDSETVFFGDAVLHQKQDNFRTDLSWFVSPCNYYAENDWAKALLSQLHQCQQRPYVFDCLLGRQSPSRDLVESFYRSSQFQHKIIFSYFRQDSHINQGIWDRAVDTVTCTTDPVLVGSNGLDQCYMPLSSILPISIYNRSHFSMICDTHTGSQHFCRYTEKLAKPILAERVFVAFCDQWYLRNAKRLGFLTFDSIIDESYDNEPDQRTRFNLAWQQIEYLCQQDASTIRTSVEHVLTHNKKHFLTTDWHRHLRSFVSDR